MKEKWKYFILCTSHMCVFNVGWFIKATVLICNTCVCTTWYVNCYIYRKKYSQMRWLLPYACIRLKPQRTWNIVQCSEKYNIYVYLICAKRWIYKSILYSLYSIHSIHLHLHFKVCKMLKCIDLKWRRKSIRWSNQCAITISRLWFKQTTNFPQEF